MAQDSADEAFDALNRRFAAELVTDEDTRFAESMAALRSLGEPDREFVATADLATTDTSDIGAAPAAQETGAAEEADDELGRVLAALKLEVDDTEVSRDAPPTPARLATPKATPRRTPSEPASTVTKLALTPSESEPTSAATKPKPSPAVTKPVAAKAAPAPVTTRPATTRPLAAKATPTKPVAPITTKPTATQSVAAKATPAKPTAPEPAPVKATPAFAPPLGELPPPPDELLPPPVEPEHSEAEVGVELDEHASTPIVPVGAARYQHHTQGAPSEWPSETFASAVDLEREAPALDKPAVRDQPPSPWGPRIAAGTGTTMLILCSVVLWVTLLGSPDSSAVITDTRATALPAVTPAAPGVDRGTAFVTDERLTAEITQCNASGMVGAITASGSGWVTATVQGRFVSATGTVLGVTDLVEELVPTTIRVPFSFSYDPSLAPAGLEAEEPWCEVTIRAIDGP